MLLDVEQVDIGFSSLLHYFFDRILSSPRILSGICICRNIFCPTQFFEVVDLSQDFCPTQFFEVRNRLIWVILGS